MSLDIDSGVAIQPGVKSFDFGWSVTTGWFDATVTDLPPRVISSTESNLVTDDSAYVLRTIDGVEAIDRLLTVTKMIPFQDFEIDIDLESGDGIELDGSILYSRETGTPQTLTVSSPKRTMMFEVEPEINVIGEPVDVFQAWVPGSLEYFCATEIDGLIASLTPSATTQDLFVGDTRNPDLFCAAYAESLTAIACWNSAYNSPVMGVDLITPQHAVGASHGGAFLPTGTVCRWRTVNGTAIERTIIGRTGHLESTDISIYLFDSPVPSTIHPLKILPANIGDYLRHPEFRPPVLFADRTNKCCVGEFLVLDDSDCHMWQWPASKRGEFYIYPGTGTSGKPIMIPVGGELALVGTFLSPTSGPAHHNINWAAHIAALDGRAGVFTGYQPEIADLSDFTIFATSLD